MSTEKIRLTYPDLLYGELHVAENDWKIFRTPQMARIRQISLSAVPDWALSTGTPPSRFEHSLGTAHLARVVGRKPGFREVARDLYFSALVHDVGTPPFSHISEPFQIKITGKNHEAAVEDYLFDSELGEEIKSQGGDLPRIVRLVKGEEEQFGPLINGSIDLDNLDNSLRYLVGLGLSGGKKFYSPEELAKSYEMFGNRLVLRTSSEELGGWFKCRSRTYEFVYSPRNLSPSTMLSRALKFAEREGGLDNSFFGKDESEAKVYLKTECNKRTSKLIERMEMWRHHVQVLNLEASEVDEKWQYLFKDIDERFRVADEVSQILGTEPENVCVYFGRDRGYKEIDIPVLDDKNQFILPSVSERKQRWMVQVFVSPELEVKKRTVKRALAESIESKNLVLGNQGHSIAAA